MIGTWRRATWFSAIVLLLFSCAPAPVAADAGANDAVAVAFRDHRSEVQVTATGTVTRVLADDDGATGPHQRFIVQLAGRSQTILVTNNLTVGRRVPLRPGDTVTIRGEYIWNTQGGLVHFTHRDPDGSHEGGWIEAGGRRYD